MCSYFEEAASSWHTPGDLCCSVCGSIEIIEADVLTALTVTRDSRENVWNPAAIVLLRLGVNILKLWPPRGLTFHPTVP